MLSSQCAPGPPPAAPATPGTIERPILHARARQHARTPLPASPFSPPCPPQNFVKVDTTLVGLHGLSEELGVKALPAFKFFRSGVEQMPQARRPPPSPCCRRRAEVPSVVVPVGRSRGGVLQPVCWVLPHLGAACTLHSNSTLHPTSRWSATSASRWRRRSRSSPPCDLALAPLPPPPRRRARRKRAAARAARCSPRTLPRKPGPRLAACPA